MQANKHPPASFADTVVFLFILLDSAFLGFFTHPIPFLPKNGLATLFSLRLTLPVVRAEIDFLIDGFLIQLSLCIFFRFYFRISSD